MKVYDCNMMLDVKHLNFRVMKKMMMFLVMSIFCLMGGVSDGVAQKKESKSEVSVVMTPNSILAQVGQL